MRSYGFAALTLLLSFPAYAQDGAPEPKTPIGKCNKEVGGWYANGQWVINTRDQAMMDRRYDCLKRMGAVQ